MTRFGELMLLLLMGAEIECSVLAAEREVIVQDRPVLPQSAEREFDPAKVTVLSFSRIPCLTRTQAMCHEF
jgi:hypothetical protein